MGIKAHRQTLETVSSVAREFIEKNPEAKSFSLPSEYSLPREGYYGAVKYLIESFYSL